MTETVDLYTAGTSPEDFTEADLPDVMPGDDADDAAPWGYTTDPQTGEKRPKKAPGRPRKQPDASELATAPELERDEDRPPARPSGRPKPPSVVPPQKPEEPRMPKGGVIAAGVNKLYRRAGKIVRGLENGDEIGIGQALIECTRIDPDEPDGERELTVGEAWENLAKTNPRIRAFLLKLMQGGDITDLVMAHAPIGVALYMKPWVQRFIPAERLIESLTEEDEDEPEGTALPGGLTREDIQAMQDLTQEQAEQMARKAAEGMGAHVSDADIQRAARHAMASMQQRRQQPKKQTRAQRAGAR